MTFFKGKKGLISLLVAVILFVVTISQCGDEPKVEKRRQQKEAFYCEELTGELCQNRCKPFEVKVFRPGYVLRHAVDDGIYLFRSCSRGAIQESVGDFASACECDP